MKGVNDNMYNYYNSYLNDYYESERFVDLSFLGFELNRYFISNYGRVYSKVSNKFLKLQVSTHGYYYIALGASNREFVHRLVAKAFVYGESNERNCVNHIDGNKMNNYYKNLEWCSKAENNRHAYSTHLNNCIGENCRSAKLTNEQVHHICKLLEKSDNIWDIIDSMKMERTMNNYEIIRSIRKGYAWKSISKDYKINQTDYPIDSIPEFTVREICKCFEDGMKIPETYEKVFKKKYTNSKDCDKYNTLKNIASHRSYKYISENYNF